MPANSQIKVETLRTVFFWPLVLEFSGNLFEQPSRAQHQAMTNAVASQFDRLCAETPWKPVRDTLRHIGGDEGAEDAYAEYVYFHDFLQNTLFGSKSDPKDNHPLLLLQRSDITEIEVKLPIPYNEPETIGVQAKVERLNLYLVRPGIAVMALQVATKTIGDLGTFLLFNDLMRRSHLPYFSDKKPSASRPETVTFILSGGGKRSFDTAMDLGGATDKARDSVRSPRVEKPGNVAEQLWNMPPDERKILPYSHWRWLLSGDNADVFPFQRGQKDLACWWRHFSDERLPLLTTCVLDSRDDYYAICDGNWSRLTFVDPPGSDPTPYASDFLKATFPSHTYDRYHHAQNATADAPVRYLMCDYAMSCVTYRSDTREDYQRNGDYTNHFAKIIETHMQRHYYQMFLLAVIDKSVLLNISSRISNAVGCYDRARSKKVREDVVEDRLMAAMEEINRDFLHYVHRFRFSGVSGQLQPTEMYTKLRAIMNLEGLYEDIRNELDTAVAFLSGRSEKRAAEASERLGVIATLALVFGLVIAFFSMNIVTEQDILFSKDASADDMWKGGMKMLLGWGGCAAIVAFVFMGVMSYLRSRRFWEGRFYPKFTQGCLLLIGLCSILTCLVLAGLNVL